MFELSGRLLVFGVLMLSIALRLVAERLRPMVSPDGPQEFHLIFDMAPSTIALFLWSFLAQMPTPSEIMLVIWGVHTSSIITYTIRASCHKLLAGYDSRVISADRLTRKFRVIRRIEDPHAQSGHHSTSDDLRADRSEGPPEL